MNSNDVKRINVLSMSAPYEVTLPNADTKMQQIISVVYRGEHEGETKELIISNSIYPLDKIEVGNCYMVISDEKGIVQFFEDAPTYYHREAFALWYYPILTKTISQLQYALDTCNSEKDRKLIKDSMDSIFYTMIALGRKSDLEADDAFFSCLPF